MSGNHVQIVGEKSAKGNFYRLGKKTRSSSIGLIRVSPHAGNGTVVALTTIRVDKRRNVI